VAVSGGMLSAS